MPSCLQIATTTIEPNAPQHDSDAMWLPQPDWIPHRLTISGPTNDVAAFYTAAAGAGIIPWRLDDRAAEENWRNLLLSVPAHHRGIRVQEIGILTGDLRDAWLIRNEAAIERVGRERDCPLDLHALIPVPAPILALGEQAPAALRWLWENWGTTWPLRQVRLLQAPKDRRLTRSDVLTYHFSAADWSPWRAIEHLRRRWPVMVFDLKPDYG